METKLNLVTEIAKIAIKVNINEEPCEGKPQARFCEGCYPYYYILKIMIGG